MKKTRVTNSRLILTKWSHLRRYLKVDFHSSVWQRERDRERENYHVGMRSLIFLLSHRKIFMSVCSREKVKLRSTFSRTLTGKPNDNQSNRLIFANVAFLLFLNSQSNTILSALFSYFKSVPRPFLFPIPVPVPHSRSCCQTDKWKSTLRFFSKL